MKKTIKPNILPRHIAIVPDGNNRWAKERGKTMTEGHRAGVKAIQKTVEAAIKSGIEVLTIWIYSTENLNRPKSEVDYLMHLSKIGLRAAFRAIRKGNVCVRFIGDFSHLPKKLCTKMQQLTAATQHNTGLKLVIAAGYGGKWDIVEATRKIAEKVRCGALSLDAINEELFASYLSIADLPGPDLLIRTSGEQRISNFYLWQLAYTEFYFPKLFWPDFDEAAFRKALKFFATRKRRFGVREN